MKFNARRVSLFDRFIFQPGKRVGKSSPACNASRSRRGAREHVENHERVEIISGGGGGVGNARVTLSPPIAIDSARLQADRGKGEGAKEGESHYFFDYNFRARVPRDRRDRSSIDQSCAREITRLIFPRYAGSAARIVEERGKYARVTRGEHSQLRYVTLAACEHCRRVMPTCRGGGTCVIHLAVSRHGH